MTELAVAIAPLIEALAYLIKLVSFPLMVWLLMKATT